MEVRNRFKGLELIECLENLGRCSGHCTGEKDQDHTPTKKCEKAKKMAVSGGLTNSCEKQQKAKENRKDQPI